MGKTNAEKVKNWHFVKTAKILNFLKEQILISEYKGKREIIESARELTTKSEDLQKISDEIALQDHQYWKSTHFEKKIRTPVR